MLPLGVGHLPPPTPVPTAAGRNAWRNGVQSASQAQGCHLWYNVEVRSSLLVTLQHSHQTMVKSECLGWMLDSPSTVQWCYFRWHHCQDCQAPVMVENPPPQAVVGEKNGCPDVSLLGKSWCHFQVFPRSDVMLCLHVYPPPSFPLLPDYSLQ